MGEFGKRCLSLLLAVVLFIGILPIGVIAAEETEADDYIEICTIEDLYNVRLDLTANYKLMNDIDLTEATASGGAWDYGGRGWNPIGSNDIYDAITFSGTFDGNGYSIIGMRIYASSMPSGVASTTYAGLFAKVSGEVRDLNMVNVNITNGCYYTGAIAGYNIGTITDCSVDGTVKSDEYAGGITGYNTGTISYCYNTAAVTGYWYTGGIAGYNTGSISVCYNTGAITDTNSSGYAGGIAGYNKGSITNAYNTGAVTAKYRSGGIAGYCYGSTSAKATIGACYNVGEVKVGTSLGYGISYIDSYLAISQSYYLKGQGSTGATSLTAAQMLLPSMYTGFDFENTWVQNSAAEYPYPQLQFHPQDLRVIESVTLVSAPDKTEYAYGEELDLSGAELKISIEDDEDQILSVSADMVSGFSATTPGTQTITVTYKGRTVTFEVVVGEKVYTPIYTVEDLYNIRKNLSGSYRLMNDIDLTDATAPGGAWDFNGNGWNPIGSGDVYGSSAFSGEFDGNGHKIIGMRIDVTKYPSGVGSSVYVGLFAKVTGSVYDLTFVGGAVKVSGTYKTNNVGSLAGYAGNATITNVHDQMDKIYADGYGDYYNYIGGVVGYSSGSKITLCVNNASITAYTSSASTRNYAGGICGYMANAATVSRSYNTAVVTADGSGSTVYNYAAGICGYVYAGTISQCYNAGNIKSVDAKSDYNDANGISCSGTVSQCYNVGTITSTGSRCAIGGSSTSGSYYLAGTGTSNTGATPLTAEQMLLTSMYTGFDFENTWVQNSAAEYPYPQLQFHPQDLRVIESVTLVSAPDKTEYAYGEELDLSGAELKISIEDDEDQILSVSADMVSGFSATTPGTQTITVTYKGRTVTFEVVVGEKVYTPIYTVEDLYNIRRNLSGSYRLMNDIDLTDATAPGGAWDFNGNGWNPIGSGDVYGSSAFSGEFDGNGHSITGLRINITALPSGTGTTIHLGLFANVTGTVKNLRISGNIRYSGSKTYYMGAVAALCSGSVENCKNNATISGTASSMDINGYVGGIVGKASGNAKFHACVNTGNISSLRGSHNSESNIQLDENRAGGIAGDGASTVTITKCYNTGNVSASADGYSYYYGKAYAAGIAPSATIRDCYNTGNIEATAVTGSSSSSYRYAYGIGGTASRCYNIGTTAGYSGYAIASDTSTNCYYLSGTGSSNTGSTSLTETQMRLQAMYAGFDFENTWVLNQYANHPYPQLKSNIQDLDESASIVSIISWPVKTEYMTGDELDLDGCVMNVIYVSGQSEQRNVTADMISGFDNTTTGEQIITVTYRGGSDTFPVTVKARPEVTAIELISGPDQTEFRVGTTFDFAGAQIKVSYSDGTTEVVDVTVDMTTGGNIHHLGKQTITVTFYGQTATFGVKVTPVTISELKLEAAPDKLTYLEGEELNTAGMVLVAVMNNGTEQQVNSGYTVSGYSSNPGKHTVKISYMGKSVTFDVTVETKTVVELVLKAAPTKKVYVSGEEFDPTGMMVVATFDNGEIAVVEDYELSGYDDVPGIKTVIVSYGGKYVAFSVRVVARVITDFRITAYPAKLEYLQNEVFDSTGLQVEATYNDGTTEEVTDYEVIGFSSNPGTHTVSVAYKGWVETFTIQVSPRTLTDLIVVTPSKLTYYLGEEFDISGMSVMAYYDNGQKVAVEDYTISGFDSNVPGTKTITITYGGLTSSFGVLVSERSQITTEGSIAVGNVIGRLGEQVVVPVSVFKNTGVAGFKHTITFDADNLSFVKAEFAAAFAGGSVVVNDENADKGQVSIVWYDVKDVLNDGTVYTLTFEVLEQAQDGATAIEIDFSNNDNGNISGENVLFEAVDGSVEVRSYWLGDLTGDRLCRVADLLKLAQYVAGKKMTLTEKQLLAADVNEDAEIDIHDVILLQQWILNAGVQNAEEPALLALLDKVLDELSEPVEISLGQVAAVSGQEVVVPVTIKNNTGISAFMFEISYDADDLTFVSAENGEVLNKGAVAVKTDEEKQTVTILWYSASGDVAADGEIVPLTFQVSDTAEGNYDLSVRYVAEDILDEDNHKVNCDIFDGKIEIISMENVDVEVVAQTATTTTLAVTNKTADVINACVITTAYDANGKQLSYTMKQETLEPQKPVTVTVEFSAEADSLKIFLLDPVNWKPSNFAKQLPVG